MLERKSINIFLFKPTDLVEDSCFIEFFLSTAWFDINPEKNYNVYVSGAISIFMYYQLPFLADSLAANSSLCVPERS